MRLFNTSVFHPHPEQSFHPKKKNFLKALSVTLLTLFLATTLVSAAELSMEDFKALHAYREKVAASDNPEGIKTRTAIAKNFLEVKNGNMTTDAFYKELSKMEMFAGLEPRHALMLVKNDIIQHLGTSHESFGQEYFFGKRLSAVTEDGKKVGGGTEVERVILENRRKIVMDAVEKVLNDFKGQNVVDGVKYSVYLAEIGGWASELPEEMKLAGDIDFSFFCGNMEIAARLKAAYDDYILKTYGMTPEQMDIPCTAHGQADFEVYVGKHGQAFAEKYMKQLRPVNLDPDAQTRIGKGVDGKAALTDILMEAKFSKAPLTNLQKVNWPTEPGISLEMIRHFEHDIAGKDVYSDIESFIKAAKYADRSNQAVIEAGGKVIDEDLSKFCTLLVERKHAPPDTLANIIRDYFQKKGTPLPYEVDLAPSQTGHKRGTLIANKKAIKAFWDTCRKTMWENANDGFRLMIGDLHARVATIDPADITPNGDLTVKIAQLREMMEMQSRIMHSDEVGVKDIPKDFDTNMRDFRTIYNDFLKKARGKAKAKSRVPGSVGPEEAQKIYEFADKMKEVNAKTRGDVNIKMAAAAVIGLADQVNDSLDFIDNALFDDIKGGTVDTGWYVNLKKAQEVTWSEKINTFLGNDNYFSQYKIEGERKAAWDALNQKVNEIEMSINIKLLDNCVARGVRGINQSFNRSVAQSTGGTYMMKGLALINLKEEVPVYLNLVYNEKWEELGYELFKRRFPAGSVMDNIASRGYDDTTAGRALGNQTVGKYLTATWDLVTVVIPPLSLANTAFSIGGGLADKAWEYGWSEELDKFVADLYESADFTLLRVQRVGEDQIKLTDWRLDSVVYKGEKVDFIDFFEKKEQQIKEMQEFVACRANKLLSVAQTGQRSRDRSTCQNVKSHHEVFPTEYLHDGITGRFGVDSILEENLGQNDPLLMLLKEMKKHSIAGPKVKEAFKDIEDVRWEQLKLAFMRKIKEDLEKRRAGEDILLRGDVYKLLDELLKIARALKIEDEVKKNVKRTIGERALKAILYVGDLFNGIKRTAMLEPDVWDAYEQEADTIAQYVKTYKLILKNRKEAEKRISPGGDLTDNDLRILTGKYFLEGKESVDKTGAQEWAQLPIQQEVEAETKLKEILDVCGSKDVLDIQNPGSEGQGRGNDYDIYIKMVYHGVFREMWKHVYDNSSQEDSWLTTIARGYVDFAESFANDDSWVAWGVKRITGVPDLPEENRPTADETWNTITGTDPNAKSDQDIAKERHEYHAKQIKELIKQFEGQHCTERKTKLEDLLELTRKIEQLSQEAIALSQGALTTLNKVKAKLDGVKQPVLKLEAKIQQLQSTVAQSNQVKANVNFDHSQVEQLTTKLGGVAANLDKTANYVCEKVKELQNVDNNSQRNAICRDIDRYRPGVRDNYNLAKNYYKQIKEKRERVKKEVLRLEQLKKSLDDTKDLDDLLKILKETGADLDSAADNIAKARQKTEEIPPLREEARDLIKLLRKQIKPMLRTESGKEAMETVDDCKKRIEAAYKDSRNCFAPPGVEHDKIKPVFKELENRINNLKDAVKKLRELYGQPEEDSDYIKGVKEKLDLIEYLDQMAVRYVERIAMSSADADYCFGLADGLKDKPVSYVIPNFQGQPVNQVLGILQRVGLSVTPNEQRPANDPNKEYKVISTVPQAGIEVKIATTSVTVHHYGQLDVEGYLRNVNCDHIRNSYPYYDSSRRTAVCKCQQGLVMNTSGNACIDCLYFEQNFYASYNAGNIRGAQQWAAEARNCPFAANAQAMLDDLIRQQQCQDIANQMWGAIQAGNLYAAQSLYDQAMALGCPLDPALINALRQLMQDEQRRQEEITRRNTENLITMWNQVFNPDGGFNPGGDYYPPIEGGGYDGGGGGHRGPPQQLTSRTITGHWNVTGSHGGGSTTRGYVNFQQNGSYSYRLDTDHPNSPDSTEQGTGTWTLNQNHLDMKFDRGGKYEGTAQGHSNAFTLSVSNNGWTLNFRR